MIVFIEHRAVQRLRFTLRLIYVTYLITVVVHMHMHIQTRFIQPEIPRIRRHQGFR